MTDRTDGLRIADDLALPLDFTTRAIAILAKRGAGKTYCAAVLVEELVDAGQHVVVMDTTGVWWGLRASADGDGPGLPIAVLGGQHGDLPLTEDAGERIADLVVDERVSLVLDLTDLSKGGMKRFVTAFLARLYRRKARDRAPLHLVMDEADEFAPQTARGDEYVLLGAVIDIVRRGRSRGLGTTLVTQRPAVLHNDVLYQADALVALRMIGPADRKAVDSWIQANGTAEQREEVMASLAPLQTGTAWVWAPEHGIFGRHDIRRRRTFDSSATPQAGQRYAEPVAFADVDLDRLRKLLEPDDDGGDSAGDSDSVEGLLATIDRLRRDLSAAQAERPEPEVREVRVEVPVEVRVPVPNPDLVRRLETLTDRMLKPAEEIRDALGTFRQYTDDIARVVAEVDVSRELRRAYDFRARQLRDGLPGPADAARAAAEDDHAQTPDTGPAANDTSAKTEADGNDIPAGAVTLLVALLRHRTTGLTATQLAARAGYIASGGGFRRHLKTLTDRGLVANETGSFTYHPTLAAAARGNALGWNQNAPVTAGEIIDIWTGRLPSTPARVLQAVADHHSTGGITRDELAAQMGMQPSGGGFRRAVKIVRDADLIDDIRGRLTLSAVFHHTDLWETA